MITTIIHPICQAPNIRLKLKIVANPYSDAPKKHKQKEYRLLPFRSLWKNQSKKQKRTEKENQTKPTDWTNYFRIKQFFEILVIINKKWGDTSPNFYYSLHAFLQYH